MRSSASSFTQSATQESPSCKKSAASNSCTAAHAKHELLAGYMSSRLVRDRHSPHCLGKLHPQVLQHMHLAGGPHAKLWKSHPGAACVRQLRSFCRKSSAQRRRRGLVFSACGMFKLHVSLREMK